MSSVSDKVQVESHIKQRVQSLRNHFRQHVDAFMDGVDKIVSGRGADDLATGLKVVQAGADIAKDVTDAVVGDWVVKQVDITLDSIKDQAQITRQGRTQR